MSSHIFLDKGQSLVVSTTYTCVNFSVDIPLFIVLSLLCFLQLRTPKHWKPLVQRLSQDFLDRSGLHILDMMQNEDVPRVERCKFCVCNLSMILNDWPMVIYGSCMVMVMVSIFLWLELWCFCCQQGLVYASTEYVNDPDDFLGTKLVLLSCIIGERRRRQGQEINIVIE